MKSCQRRNIAKIYIIFTYHHSISYRYANTPFHIFLDIVLPILAWIGIPALFRGGATPSLHYEGVGGLNLVIIRSSDAHIYSLKFLEQFIPKMGLPCSVFVFQFRYSCYLIELYMNCALCNFTSLLNLSHSCVLPVASRHACSIQTLMMTVA